VKRIGTGNAVELALEFQYQQNIDIYVLL